MIKNIRHTGIVVDDLTKSLEFYTQKLGFKVSNRMDESGPFIDKILGFNNIMLTTVKMTLHDGQMVELLDFTSHKKEDLEKHINDIGPTHLAFTVDDLDAIYIDFKNDGVCDQECNVEECEFDRGDCEGVVQEEEPAAAARRRFVSAS